MSQETILRIRQDAPRDGKYPIRLILKRPGKIDHEGTASVAFGLTPAEQADIRWYVEDYLELAEITEQILVTQVEELMVRRGVELFETMLEGSRDVRRIFDRLLDNLQDVRLEISTGVAEAASIPWELMREPASDSPLALRVKSFVRVQSGPSLGFVSPPEASDGRVRLLYVVCRPGGSDDVALRAVANRLLVGLGDDLGRFEFTALRPPTFERLQEELLDAWEAGRPYHIVHFDGHGLYSDLSRGPLAEWRGQIPGLAPGAKRGYLLFEHLEKKSRPVPGDALGKLLRDTGVPVLVLNACQSAMHQASEKPQAADSVHEEIRAIGSLAQAVVDQGIPAVLGMRYSVYVDTAAKFIGQLYANLAKGRGFGQAANEGRKHLYRNPERWVGLKPNHLSDWFVPVVYEAQRLQLLTAEQPLSLSQERELDPIQLDPGLMRYVPDEGFVGRDETLLLLDRAFDRQRVVLLHAYAGQGKTATAVEFARWYAQTGGLGAAPEVLFTSFERRTNLDQALNQFGRRFAALLEAYNVDWWTLDSDERRTVATKLLRLIPVLWIWDNVEPVAGFPAGADSTWTPAEQAELAGFLKQIKLDGTSKARLLLTSRRDEDKWLGGIPYRLKMPPMSRDDAAALAISLGRERNLTRAEVAKWGPLLRYCAGNPLTLRVVVGQVIRSGLREEEEIKQFVRSLYEGERHIEDVDEAQGRARSLGASLDYGFRHAFDEEELPVIALLHLFDGMLDVRVLALMGLGDYALREIQGKDREALGELLDRAREIGLLTHVALGIYSVHPALPWFLEQQFARWYDGAAGRPRAEAALRSWARAMGGVADFYWSEVEDGNRETIFFLAALEKDLLKTRRLARSHGWWGDVIAAMQGLRALYGSQNRTVEWANLVAEIRHDFCTDDDEPIPGREDGYRMTMEYRVQLATDHQRDFARAVSMQRKLVAFNRERAESALALPEEVPLEGRSRTLVERLAIAHELLGRTLFNIGDSDCISEFEKAIRYYQRLDKPHMEALAHYNVGHAFLSLLDIRDLDAAEAAYRRCLALIGPDDKLIRAQCTKQIGMVYHDRYRTAIVAGESQEAMVQHIHTAEELYLKALAEWPDVGWAKRGPTLSQLGNLYAEVGMYDAAREQYDQALQLAERLDDRHGAGQLRYNIASMYRYAAEHEEAGRRREALQRARAYAVAALRDFETFGGQAADGEESARELIAQIDADLGRQ